MSDEHDDGAHGLQAAAGLARIALSASWRTTEWAVRTATAIPRRVVGAALHPGKARALARDLRNAVPVPGPGAPPQPDASTAAPTSGGRTNGYDPDTASTLRKKGAELLRQSRDVHYEFGSHPAYERILSELAPDEARILRLLLLDGPQPAVDVRTGGPLGMIHSRLIAPGLSMIGARAGLRYVDRVPAYLNNLFRLGLIWFSRETLRDPRRYQVLEAQPDVLAALHSVGHAKVVRRSIHLTPFGEDFCRTCLSDEGAALDRLPAHSKPPDEAPPAAKQAV
jgi:hypothetical protein